MAGPKGLAPFLNGGSDMGEFFVAYLAVAGGLSAGLQVTRGVIRGVTRLIEGEPRAAVGEVVGGFVAPVATAIDQAGKLSGEVWTAMVAISTSGEEATPDWRAPRWRTGPATTDLSGVPR